jgi:CDP-diacylglycerol--glycerol-3-phosphate 3-phosphatidyltransferase
MSRFSNLLPQRLPAGFADRVGRTVAKTGLTPNMLSCIGLAGNVVAAVLVARGELLIAAFVFLFFSVVDLLDGSVARATGRATPFGAVLDAVFDRLGEGIVLCGIAWYFAERGENVQVAVTFAAMLGGVSVSYLRARAEIEGMVMREGFFRRQERVALVTLGLLFNALTLAIWPLAILSHLTVLQRFVMLIRSGPPEGEAANG